MRSIHRQPETCEAMDSRTRSRRSSDCSRGTGERTEGGQTDEHRARGGAGRGGDALDSDLHHRRGGPVTAYETIIYETSDDHVATITLNRPDILNAFDRQMCEDVRHAWRRVKDDPS